MVHKFKFTSVVEKFVVVFLAEDELMFAEIRNFPTEKELWEADILFNPDLRGYIVMIVTADDYTWNRLKLTEEESNNILYEVRKTHFSID